MRLIMELSDDIRHNIDEAQHHINKAYAMRDECKAAADWYRTMALSHLDFNTAGHVAVKKLIEDYRASGKHSDLQPGMMAVYEAQHNELIRKANEVRYLVDSYSK